MRRLVSRTVRVTRSNRRNLFDCLQESMTDLQNAASVIDNAVLYSPQLLGKECGACFNVLAYRFFRLDSSSRDGRVNICLNCEKVPRLSMREHVSRLREQNYYSQGVARQRWANQEDYRNWKARQGTYQHHSDLVRKLQPLIPELFVTNAVTGRNDSHGRFVRHLAFFQLSSNVRPDWDNRTIRLLCWCERDWMPEYSTYEFDNVRDVLIREDVRGWRTVLLSLIHRGVLTEELCDATFGIATGEASTVWYRELYKFRNRH